MLKVNSCVIVVTSEYKKETQEILVDLITGWLMAVKSPSATWWNNHIYQDLSVLFSWLPLFDIYLSNGDVVSRFCLSNVQMISMILHS